MSDFILPDEFYQINIEGWEHPVVVNAKYDRVDYFPRNGAWILKVYDDEVGLMAMHVDEATARRVAEFALLPIVERPTMFASEHEGYLIAQQNSLEEWL